MKKLLTAAVIVGLLVLGCHPMPPKPDKIVDHMADKIRSELSLTSEQNLKLQAIVTTIKNFHNAQKEKTAAKITDAKTLILDDQLSTERLNQFLDKNDQENHAAQGKLREELEPQFVDFQHSLTPDQRKKLVEMIDKLQNWLKS